jgi:hypothetical protein
VAAAMFGLQKMEAGAALEYGVSGRLIWTNGVFFSTRRYALPPPDARLDMFAAGPAAKIESGLLYDALRIPERRLFVQVGANVQGGPGPSGAFSKFQASAALRWNPSARLNFRSEWGAGKAIGAVPFDEMFLLGMDRDSDLWLRGHVVATDGRKGSGPISRAYVLNRNEISRTVLRTPFLRCDVGPFLDVGRVSEAWRSGFRGWLVDTGLQSKFRFPGGLVFTLISGFDTRTGSSVIYTAVGR